MLHLVKIQIQNIRSYGADPVTIDFQPGITLFSGDIGCGKSTILSAIEFALFGLGDVKSGYLLRHNETEGSVILTFIAGPDEYTVTRTLTRTKRGVNQGPCTLEGPAGKETFPPAEMKPKILEILGFNEQPDPKATSRIFRYAIYTPQESMKAVLTMKEDQRLDILRRAFGIDQYRWAALNAEEALIKQWLNTEVEVLARLSSGRAEDEFRRDAVLKAIADLDQNEKNQAAMVLTLSADYQQTQSEIDRVLPARERLTTVNGVMPELIKGRQNEAARLDDLWVEEQTIAEDLRKLQSDEDSISRLTPQYESLTSHRKRQEALQGDWTRYHETVVQLEGVNVRIDDEGRRLRDRLEVCRSELEKLPEMQKARTDHMIRQAEMNQEKDRLEQDLIRLPEVSARLNDMIAGELRLRSEQEHQEAAFNALVSEWGQISEIGIGAPCPRCQQTLTLEHLAHMGEETETVAATIRSQQAAIREMIGIAHEKIAGTREEFTTLESAQARLTQVKIGLAEIQAALPALVRDEDRIWAYLAEDQEISAALEAGTYAAEFRQQQQDLMNEILTLSDAAQEYDQVAAAIKDLESARVEWIYMETAGRLKNKPLLLERWRKVKTAIVAGEVEVRTYNQKIQEAEQALTEAGEAVKVLEVLEASAVEKLTLYREAERIRESYMRDSQFKGRELEDVKAVIEKKGVGLSRMAEYQEHRRWIKDHFLPAIESIERSRLAQINETFNAYFQQWFMDLIASEEITVRVDDAFTPLVEQDGYEVDAEALSGGERTSLALAYRLALNTIVRNEIGGDQDSLLILDEPTDGFSAAQLYRLRDILRDAGCDQMIMVSHEKEMEGFVDQVYSVTKTSGISTVTRG